MKEPQFAMDVAASTRIALWRRGVAASAVLAAFCLPIRAEAQPPATPVDSASAGVAPAAYATSGWTYADLADLVISSDTVIKVVVKSQAVVEPARAPGVRPGFVRLYVEAQPLGALAGPLPSAAIVRYLVDVPVDASGKPPRYKKQLFILFSHVPAGAPVIATPVPGAPPPPPAIEAIDLQLVAPDAQLAWGAEAEARVSGVVAELAAPGAPPAVSGVREAIYVPGNLAGEGETQIFLATAAGSPASISVEHAPGQPVRWSASFSEVVDPSGQPPARDTLAWYRLACALPPALPFGANVSESDDDKATALADYQIVRAQLGPCSRNRN